MPRVFIPPQLRELTAGQAELSVDGGSVGELIAALDARYPGLRDRLCKGPDLSPTLQVSIDHELTRRGLNAKVRPESEVHFLPVFGGG